MNYYMNYYRRDHSYFINFLKNALTIQAVI